MDMQKLWPKVRRLEDQMAKQPGGKQFKLTVDDAGAIKATEAT